MYVFCYYTDRTDPDPRLHTTTCRFAIGRNSHSRSTAWSDAFPMRSDAEAAMLALGLPVIHCRVCNP